MTLLYEFIYYSNEHTAIVHIYARYFSHKMFPLFLFKLNIVYYGEHRHS